MSLQVLKLISDEMSSLSIPYEFGEWTTDPVPNMYFVGEYDEIEPTTEDGLQETTFILTGTSRTTWLSLETAKNNIENTFNKVSGKTVILSNNNGVAVFYSNALIVPTGNDELKRMQINLIIKEWSVS